MSLITVRTLVLCTFDKLYAIYADRNSGLLCILVMPISAVI